MSDSLWPHGLQHQASPSITNSQSLLKLMSIESVMPSNHFILYCPLLLLPSIFPSIRVFSNESVLHIRWPKYWSFSFDISPANEHTGLISFRMDWLDFLAVEGTLKNLLQHHSSKAPILPSLRSNSHIYLYMATSFDHIWPFRPYLTFVGKVLSLFLNILSRFVIAFLPRSNCLLITWLQSPSPILEAKKYRVSHGFQFFPIYLPWSDGTRCHDISFLNAEL